MALASQIEAAAKAPKPPARDNKLVETSILAMPVSHDKTAEEIEAGDYAERRDAAEVVAGRMIDHPCDLSKKLGITECGHPDHKQDADALDTALDILGLTEDLRPKPAAAPVVARSRPRPRFVPRPDTSWTQDAACKGVDLKRFYPAGESAAHEPIVKAAMSICRICPVRKDCLEYALTRPEKHGIWGGMTEHQRANEVRRRQRRAKAVVA